MDLNKQPVLQRKVWLVLSDVVDKVTDLLPSNRGRQSLVSSLHKAYALDLRCYGLVTISQANASRLETYHDKRFVEHLFKNRKEVDETCESFDVIERLLKSNKLNSRYRTDAPHTTIESESDSSEVNTETDTSDDESIGNDIENLDEQFGLTHDCYVFPFMADYVKLVAGTSVSAAQTLVREHDRNTHNIAVNWYGGRHHCKRSKASGYCYINDIIISISELRKTFSRVFYLDLDLHHGDGVEKGYEFSKNVMTCSIHRYDLGFFPGSGSLESSSKTKINIPTKKGLSDSNMMYIIQQIVIPLVRQFDPNALVIQCGCDGLGSDEHKEWNLTIGGYGRILDHLISEIPCPALILGGGGYNSTEAAKCWTHVTKILLQIEEDWDMIPEHEYLETYEADGFQFWTMENRSPKLMPDHNNLPYLKGIKDYIEKTVY